MQSANERADAGHCYSTVCVEASRAVNSDENGEKMGKHTMATISDFSANTHRSNKILEGGDY